MLVKFDEKTKKRRNYSFAPFWKGVPSARVTNVNVVHMQFTPINHGGGLSYPPRTAWASSDSANPRHAVFTLSYRDLCGFSRATPFQNYTCPISPKTNKIAQKSTGNLRRGNPAWLPSCMEQPRFSGDHTGSPLRKKLCILTIKISYGASVVLKGGGTREPT